MYTFEEVVESSKKYFGGDELAANVFATKYALVSKDGSFLEKNPNYIQDFMKEYYYGYNFNSIDIFVKECNKLINN